MGIRFASLRHSDVVMAPALTEAGQSQNFKLPSAHTSPSSPIGVSFNGHKHVSVPRFLSDDDVYTITTSDKTITKNKKFLNCANGFRSAFLKCSVDAGSLAYDNLKTLAIASELLNKRTELSEGIVKGSGVCGGTEHLRMNYSDPSMGDNKDKMGLQKSSTAIRALESGRVNRAQSGVNKVDSQIKIFNTTFTRNSKKNETVNCASASKKPSLPPTAGVSKGPGGAINSRLKTGTDVLESNSDNSKTSFETPRGVDETFEREFFNSMNVMELCVDDTKGFISDENGGVSKESIETLRKKQHEVERRCDFLARRIRMFQAKIMVSCAERQVNNFIAYSYENMKQNSHKDLGSGECSSGAGAPSECDSVCAPIASNDRQGASQNPASTLHKSYDIINQVSTSTSRQGIRKYNGISAESSTSATVVNSPQLRLDPDVVKELDSVSGQLHTQLKFVQNELDSDVTASSSGGESCDEFLTTGDNQRTLPIERRAAWRWAQHRARIASRWTWLQAQISDLEYRIRQHNDIHRQIRLTKDPMVLADVPYYAAGGAGPPLVVNGYHGGGGSSGGGAGTSGGSQAAQGKPEEQCCARVRPLARQPQAPLPKRKLLHVQGLHAASKRASRPATVRCACRPPASVCALCTGRPDPTQPRPLHAHLPAAERAAALDPAFHPVLSMPQDVKESIYYEGIMKTTEWQQKTLRSSLKSMRAAGLPKFDRDTVVERRNKKHQVEPRRKYTSRLKKTMTNTLTAKIKKKLTKGRKQKNTDNNNHTLQRIKRRRRDGPKTGNPPYHGYEDGDDDVQDSGASVSKHTSPVASPGPASGSLERLSLQGACKLSSGESSRRKRENSYDIDNIVIPYSIASAARLEKLQYKEIPTPKWRLIENNFVGRPRLSLRNNGVIRRSSHESDVEDITDETIALRHDRCEMEEKKKFMSYIKLPYSGRSRATRRADSRAESSGANTPDPMSPNPSEYQDGISPVMSPLPPSSDQDQCCVSGTRRRTVSSSRWHRDEVRSSTPDGITEVPPFEPRKFPLADDIYDKMLKCMPEGHPYPPPCQEPKKLFAKDVEFGESRPVSPSTDSTESAIGEGEDPNDPEWTVEEEREFERDRVKSSVKR